MASSVTANYHEFYLQFTCKTVGSRRITLDQTGSVPINRMCDPSEHITLHPFAVTLYQKASRAINVLLAGHLIDPPKRTPRHMRQVMMNQRIVVVQKQQAPAPSRFVDDGAMRMILRHAMFMKRAHRRERQ